MNTEQVPARDIRVGDKIIFPSYPDTTWTVNYTSLVRGLIMEMSLKKDGLAARMLPEHKIEVLKTALLRKVIK